MINLVSAALELAPAPPNVRILFPNHEADLWTNSNLLGLASPYFETLLSSDFAESVTVPSKRSRTRCSSTAAATPVDADAKDFDDSDDETDKLYYDAHPPSQHPYKEIKITMTAFTTYRAVLAYLRTCYIAFVPLSSWFSANVDAAKPTRASRIEAVTSSDPSLPYPVSPKSAFRLAHLLELEDLQQLSLENLCEQLTRDSACTELFSDTSVCYDAWQNVILDYVVKNCDNVTKSSAWTEMTKRLERDQVDGATPIMLELFKRKVLRTA
ncbi:hypothetical protein JCM10296v2_004689 [Rhodotorula toruloides]